MPRHVRLFSFRSKPAISHSVLFLSCCTLGILMLIDGAPFGINKWISIFLLIPITVSMSVVFAFYTPFQKTRTTISFDKIDAAFTIMLLYVSIHACLLGNPVGASMLSIYALTCWFFVAKRHMNKPHHIECLMTTIGWFGVVEAVVGVFQWCSRGVSGRDLPISGTFESSATYSAMLGMSITIFCWQLKTINNTGLKQDVKTTLLVALKLFVAAVLLMSRSRTAVLAVLLSVGYLYRERITAILSGRKGLNKYALALGLSTACIVSGLWMFYSNSESV